MHQRSLVSNMHHEFDDDFISSRKSLHQQYYELQNKLNNPLEEDTRRWKGDIQKGLLWEQSSPAGVTNYQQDSGYQTTRLGGSMPTSAFMSRIPSRRSSPQGRKVQSSGVSEEAAFNNEFLSKCDADESLFSFNDNFQTNSSLNFFNNIVGEGRLKTQILSHQSTAPTSSWSSQFPSPQKKEMNLVNQLPEHMMQIKVNEEVDLILRNPDHVVGLMRHLWEEEVVSARQWLNDMSWSAHAEYHCTQDKIALMEDQFRKSFNMEPPTGDSFGKECYEDVICADTLLSMVDNAWPIFEEDEAEFTSQSDKSALLSQTSMPYSGMLKRSSSSHSYAVSKCVAVNQIKSNEVCARSSSNFSLPTPTITREQLSKTNCPPLLRRSSLPAKTELEVDIEDMTLTQDHDFLRMADSNSTDPPCSPESGKTSMQVHKRSVKPRKQDAFFNIRYKTQECVHFCKGMPCPAGDNCHFAHGSQELRAPRQHPKFKTQICKHFTQTGHCPFGKVCFFLHPQQSQQKSLFPQSTTTTTTATIATSCTTPLLSIRVSPGATLPYESLLTANPLTRSSSLLTSSKAMSFSLSKCSNSHKHNNK